MKNFGQTSFVWNMKMTPPNNKGLSSGFQLPLFDQRAHFSGLFTSQGTRTLKKSQTTHILNMSRKTHSAQGEWEVLQQFWPLTPTPQWRKSISPDPCLPVISCLWTGSPCFNWSMSSWSVLHTFAAQKTLQKLTLLQKKGTKVWMGTLYFWFLLVSTLLPFWDISPTPCTLLFCHHSHDCWPDHHPPSALAQGRFLMKPPQLRGKDRPILE